MAKETAKQDEFLKLAKELYRDAADAWDENREASEDDFLMLDGQQWDAEALSAREGRPCLVINKLEGVLKQITGDQRQALS